MVPTHVYLWYNYVLFKDVIMAELEKKVRLYRFKDYEGRPSIGGQFYGKEKRVGFLGRTSEEVVVNIAKVLGKDEEVFSGNVTLFSRPIDAFDTPLEEAELADIHNRLMAIVKEDNAGGLAA